MDANSSVAVAGDRPLILPPFGEENVAPWYGSRRVWILTAIVLAALAEAAWVGGRTDRYAAERTEVARLDDEAKRELAASWERFRKLSPAEQQRLRELHAAVAGAPDAAAVRETMEQYEAWKSGLSPQESARLVGLAAIAKADETLKLETERSSSAAKRLSDIDVKAVVAWTEKQILAQQEQILAGMPATVRQRLESLPPRDKTAALLFNLWNNRGPGGPKFDHTTIAEWSELRGELSPAAQREWDATSTPEARRLLVFDWIRQAFGRTMMSRMSGEFAQRVGDDEMKRFFDQELSETERNRLLALPREEMQGQLRRDYLRRKGLWREPLFGEPRTGDNRSGEFRQGEFRPGEFRPNDGRPGEGRPGESGFGGMRRPPGQPNGERPGERPNGDAPRRGGGASPGKNDSLPKPPLPQRPEPASKQQPSPPGSSQI